MGETKIIKKIFYWFNFILNEMSPVVMFAMRLLIAVTVAYVLAEAEIELHSFFKFVMQFYVIYPLYNHYYYKLRYLPIWKQPK